MAKYIKAGDKVVTLAVFFKESDRDILLKASEKCGYGKYIGQYFKYKLNDIIMNRAKKHAKGEL
jgi:hypothetical protein